VKKNFKKLNQELIISNSIEILDDNEPCLYLCEKKSKNEKIFSLLDYDGYAHFIKSFGLSNKQVTNKIEEILDMANKE